MRNLAVGCLVVFVVAFLAGGVILWRTVGRPAADAFGAVQDLGRIEEVRTGVRDDGPYDPPADGVLDEEQIDRYLAVQSEMRDRLEGRVATLRERYEQLEAREGDPDPGDIARAWSDMSGLLVEATRAQVDALNEEGFSTQEYDWVRSQVLAAAGHDLGYDLSRLAADETSQVPPDGAARDGAAVPSANVERVAPHRERIEESLPLALFGL